MASNIIIYVQKNRVSAHKMIANTLKQRKGRQPQQIGFPGTPEPSCRDPDLLAQRMRFRCWAYKNKAQQSDTTLYKTGPRPTGRPRLVLEGYVGSLRRAGEQLGNTSEKHRRRHEKCLSELGTPQIKTLGGENHDTDINTLSEPRLYGGFKKLLKKITFCTMSAMPQTCSYKRTGKVKRNCRV